MKSVNVLVAGGGASGLMAAIAAASCGKSVVILEKNAFPGKKLNATGNGKCNLTNLSMSKKFFNDNASDFVEKALAGFDEKDTVRFFRDSLEIPVFERNGYIYPRSEEASSVREALTREALRAGVRIICGASVNGISKKITGRREVFLVDSSEGKFSASAVIIATGGRSSPVFGSDGSGFGLASSLGHTLVPAVPALTGLLLKEDRSIMKHWKGVRFRGTAGIYPENAGKSQNGEIILTDYGISGIPVFQISRTAARSIFHGKKVMGFFSAVSDISEEDLIFMLKANCSKYPKTPAPEIFNGILKKKLSEAIFMKCGVSLKKSAGELLEKEITDLARRCARWNVEITGTAGFENSQVTSGGVSLDEINCETMGSAIVKGLFFAGEVMDVDGLCGGYNLQWAWTSGYTAGRSAAGYVTKLFE